MLYGMLVSAAEILPVYRQTIQYHCPLPIATKLGEQTSKCTFLFIKKRRAVRPRLYCKLKQKAPFCWSLLLVCRFCFCLVWDFLDLAFLFGCLRGVSHSAKSSHNYGASMRSMQVLLNKKITHFAHVSTPYPQVAG